MKKSNADDRLDMRDFPGLVLAVDPNDQPPGAAQVQVNLTCEIMGELNVRRGYLPVTFEA